MPIGVHISHEAAKKIGGIGSVLSGLCNTDSYRRKFARTLLYGPLFDEISISKPERLGKEATVFFSSLDGKTQDYPELQAICEELNVEIVYGEKTLSDEIDPGKGVKVEIVLVEIKRLRVEALDLFKFQLWEKYKFESNLYTDWDCEQYIRIAVPFTRILQSLTQPEDRVVCFAHEYMGIPSALNGAISQSLSTETVFYAHEVSTARSIVEKIPGHDVSFYRLLAKDLKRGISLETRYGSQKHNYRNELIKLAIHFDKIVAVGDWVEREYSYLQPEVSREKIDIIYNGVPTNSLSFAEKMKSRERLQEYCENLFNFKPDVIVSHITRLVISKGLWRDIRFLEEMDSYFSDHKIKGFYILLSTQIASGRSQAEVLKMEEEYGWPLLHREGYPDLVDYEIDVYNALTIFNAKSKAIKGVFINQYGFAQGITGNRIPEGTSFSDLRYGSDVELGFSIYEPFGIAQIEQVPYGGIALLSRQCGCSFLLDKVFAEEREKPYYVLDFAEAKIEDDESLLSLTAYKRKEIEDKIIRDNGEAMFRLIPKSDDGRRKLFEKANQVAFGLGWESNIADFTASYPDKG